MEKVMVYREPKRVTITKAANGFVVTTYGDRGEAIEVARSKKEATTIMHRILGRGKSGDHGKNKDTK
jgi:hypothetical protein